MEIHLEAYHEALRHMDIERDIEEGRRDGNLLLLDCGHWIFADPNWNEIALASAIQEHYNKYHGGEK